MGYIELLLLAVGLSMDAFAVSVCKGLAMKKISFRGCVVCGGWFGGFQMLMPMIGYLLGAHFEKVYCGCCTLDCVCSACPHWCKHDPGVWGRRIIFTG